MPAITGFTLDQIRAATGSIVAGLFFGPPNFSITVNARPVLDAAERSHMVDVRTVLLAFGIVVAIPVVLLAAIVLPNRRSAWVVAIFMNINFHLAGGANHPWLLAADPNGEGVDLDSLMPIIQTIISGVAFVFLRRLRSARPAAVLQPATSTARA